MDRLPDREVHPHDPPGLGRIARAADGNVEAVTAASYCDEANVQQEFLQVDDEAGSIDVDVQGRVRRSGVAATESPSLTVMRKSSASRVGRLTPRLRDDPAPKSTRLRGARGCPEEPQITGTATHEREAEAATASLVLRSARTGLLYAADEGICHMVR
jgi:hypothetical protein